MQRLPLLAAATAAVSMLPAAAGPARGPQAWSQAGCGGCHTLAAAGCDRERRAEPRRPQAFERRGRLAGHLRRGWDAVVQLVAHVGRHPGSRLVWVSSAGVRPRSCREPAGSRRPSHAKNGMSATAVRKPMQRALRKSLGLLSFSGPVTGYYGPLTTAAVKHFRGRSGLKPDGIWGSRSAAALRTPTRLAAPLSQLTLSALTACLISRPATGRHENEAGCADRRAHLALPVAHAVAATRDATNATAKKT